MSTVPLVRRRDERLLCGVCTGLSAHLGVPLRWARIAMVVLAFCGGAGVMLYLWFWVTVPWESEDELPLFRRALMKPAQSRASAESAGAAGSVGPVGSAGPASSAGLAEPVAPAAPETSAPSDRADQVSPASVRASEVQQSRAPENPLRATGDPLRDTSSEPGAASSRSPRPRIPVAELLFGACLLIAAAAFVFVQFGAQLHLEIVLPTLAVLAGVGLAWWQIADRNRPERNQLPRVLGALVLVVVGMLMFFVTAGNPNAFTVIAAAFAVLAGVALAAAPWLLRMNRELIAERAGRAREAERAEIAAHLHDSVLQTLAAIQQRSEPGSDVARLARGQERELRDWLFRGADGGGHDDMHARESLAVELRAHAAALEEQHAVRFEIVSVGAETVAAPEALLGSAREAMLNAARHAGGTVTVYLEASPERLSVDVTDRGPGLNMQTLPDGRMGVRESILGRMQRAGGTVNIVPGPGGTGTAVRLSMPRDSARTRDSDGAESRSPGPHDTPEGNA